MFVVALAELTSPLEVEAPMLASDLGASAYDARLLLAGGLPAIVRTTPERAHALDLLGRLRARGHGAVAFDGDAVVSCRSMISMRRFRLSEGAVTLADQPGLELPYGDILALIAAVHRTRVETEAHLTEKKFSVSRAVMTSGLSTRKTVKTDAHDTAEEREAVVYVYRRSGETPWILREGGTEWTGLPGPMAPTRAENFKAAAGALRSHAPHAFFDDRLVTRKASENASLRAGPGASSVTTTSESGVDLLAHVLALWTAKHRPSV